jgi:hypothetical protein
MAPFPNKLENINYLSINALNASLMLKTIPFSMTDRFAQHQLGNFIKNCIENLDAVALFNVFNMKQSPYPEVGMLLTAVAHK